MLFNAMLLVDSVWSSDYVSPDGKWVEVSLRGSDVHLKIVQSFISIFCLTW